MPHRRRGKHSAASAYGFSRTQIVVFFLIVPFIVSFCFSSALGKIHTNKSVGHTNISVLDRTAATPYASGTYMRLAYIDKLSMFNYLGTIGGWFPVNDMVTPPSPSTLISQGTNSEFPAGDGEESAWKRDGNNAELDTWVSETTGYMAARRLLKETYSIAPPEVEEGETYDQVVATGGPFLEGDIIVEREPPANTATSATGYTLIREGRVLRFVSAAPPPWVNILHEYPTVPRPVMDEGLHGPSAGLMYTVQYLDSMTEGDLLASHTVAFTGVVEQGTGTVREVGGVKEKITAAKEAGAELVFIPQINATVDPSLVNIPGVRVIPVLDVESAVKELCETYLSADTLCGTGKS